jgi:hypothetical protein
LFASLEKADLKMLARLSAVLMGAPKEEAKPVWRDPSPPQNTVYGDDLPSDEDDAAPPRPSQEMTGENIESWVL